MSAREQAREAVIRAQENWGNGASTRIADAASDVWEPLLRELTEAVGEASFRCDKPDETLRVVAAWRAARSALGEII